jgi:hypothetical protein
MVSVISKSQQMVTFLDRGSNIKTNTRPTKAKEPNWILYQSVKLSSNKYPNLQSANI